MYVMKNIYTNIVCTDNVLSGSPRIDGRRLSVGDIVSILKGENDIVVVMNDFELSKIEILQALEYCFNQQCLKDKPNVFCHN